MAKVILQASGVTAGYERPVVRDVSMEVRTGELVAVLGANGAGKSTLVKVLCGTLAPTAGTVSVQGAALSSLGRKQLSQRVAVVPQESDVSFGFTVRQVVAMGRAPHQTGLMLASDEDETAILSALRACDLVLLAERRVSDLSGGERRRVTIARALAQETAILLLDEPAAYLDVRHGLALFDIVRKEIANRELACLAVIHDLNQAARFADRAILLAEGSILAQGSVQEVMTPEMLESAFGVPIAVGTDAKTGLRYFLPGA